MPEILYFPYFGPGRRSDLRVVEIRLDFGTDDAFAFPRKISEIRQLLFDAGVLVDDDNYADKASDDEGLSWYLTLLAETALLFQQKNGHRVEFCSVSLEPGRNRYTVLVEHEHAEVGMAAVKLAIDVFSGTMDSLPDFYQLFSRLARERVLPLETEVIIKLARQRNIPVFQLEREPLAGRFNTGTRVRPNGLLILGYGENSHILDGTFCVDRAGDYLKALLRNPDQRHALLKQLGIPSVQTGGDISTGGSQFYLLIINRQVTGFEQLADGRMRSVDKVHESLIEMCRVINEKAASAMIAVSLKASSLSVPLAKSGAKVIDFDLAPNLEQLPGRCEEGPALMEAAAGELLDWLFMGSESTRFPLIAVTGTNGKTTTSRMINHILQNSGRKPGLVCTDGIFLNGKQLSDTDAGSFIGHARALTSTQVDSAVLEAHHRGIAVRGFAFQNCDVAVCLNVTEEHIHEGEIETVEDMALIKRALLERASHAAVLFADDDRCLGMIEHLAADKICLVSLQSGPEQLAGHLSQERACFCVLETVENEEWITLYKDLLRIPVMPVNQIPATFDGAARFNVSNAMHAIAACYFTGTNIDSIRSALSGFYAGGRFTPGRMNEYRGSSIQDFY